MADELSYEQAKARLEEVIAKLEDKELPLDDMVTLWEEGEKLATICQERLTSAKERLEKVRPVAD